MDPRTANMLAERKQAAASAPPPPKGVIRVAAAIVAVVILSFVYYQLVTKPAQQRERADHEVRAIAHLKTVDAARQNSLDTCLASVKTEADKLWNDQCRVRRRGAGCPLPDRVADRLERDESKSRNLCLTQFSIALQ